MPVMNDNTSGSVSRVAEHNLQIFNHFSIYADACNFLL